MSLIFIIFYAFLVECDNLPQVRPAVTPRLQTALECDAKCEDEMHTCIDDVADMCMSECARGLSLQNKASVTVGEWFECYHNCVSNAGIRCFVKGGECLMNCKEETQIESHEEYQRKLQQERLRQKETELKNQPALKRPVRKSDRLQEQQRVPEEHHRSEQRQIEKAQNENLPQFMQRYTFDPDFTNKGTYSPMSSSLSTDVGSAQLYHNIKVEVQRRTDNIRNGRPSLLSSDFISNGYSSGESYTSGLYY